MRLKGCGVNVRDALKALKPHLATRKEELIETAELRMGYIYSFNAAVAESLQDPRYAPAGFVIVGCGPNGDPMVVEVSTGRVGYASHDVLWEDPLAEVGKNVALMRLSLADHINKLRSDSKHPCDYYMVRDRKVRG